MSIETTSPKTDTGTTTNNVNVINNSIYFYSDVTENSVLTLNQSIRNTEKSLIVKSIQEDLPLQNINLYLNSYGGSFLACMSTVNIIKNCKVPIFSIIDGYAASAGTMISVVATKRFMYKYSYMLIHQLSSVHWGNFEQLKDDMKNSSEFMKTIKKIYKEYTKIPKKELDKILQHDIWWDSNKCLAMGLVDEVI